MTEFSIPLAYRRRIARVVHVGEVAVGGSEPIRIQSMITANTQDVERVIPEIRGLEEAGCEIVRLTVPTRKDLEALPEIRRRMTAGGLRVPLVADIHFNPRLALGAVPHVEKVRINPGNYVDQKRFEVREYTDAQYAEELERVEEALLPLIAALKEHGRSLRIGVNHGSLSDRVLNRHGDTPRGMVECAMEYLRILAAHGYHEIVISMKASNPLVVIQAYRLLAVELEREGMDYPLHLGVTEAGNGLEGRIKSAIGIGALLCDGLGDTVRVSLTESSLHEIPAAMALVASLDSLRGGPAWPEEMFRVSLAPEARGRGNGSRSTRLPSTRRTALGDNIGDGPPPLEIGGDAPAAFLGLARSGGDRAKMGDGAETPPEPFDALLFPPLRGGGEDASAQRKEAGEHAGEYRGEYGWRLIPPERAEPGGPPPLVWLNAEQIDSEPVRRLLREGRAFERGAILFVHGQQLLYPVRRLAGMLAEAGLDWPLAVAVPSEVYKDGAGDGGKDGALPLGLAAEIGSLAADGLLDAVLCPTGDGKAPIVQACTALMQGARLRTYATEYISCPSCGRTLFDLEEITASIKARTSHLKGVRIGIMGCIVNGPGEMADADFGYVGGAPGRINLYKGQVCLEVGVPAEEAVERLVALIKEHGAWVEE